MRKEDGVVPLRRELAVRSVDEPRAAKRAPELELEVAELEDAVGQEPSCQSRMWARTWPGSASGG